MVEYLHVIVHALNDITPLGMAAGMGLIIYQLVAKKGTIKTISDNHLSDLPGIAANLAKLVESAGRQEESLGKIRDDINYLKGRSA